MNKFLLLFTSSLIFFSCVQDMKKTNGIDVYVYDDVPLMTYYNYYDEDDDKNDDRYGALGYINEETFEVVIPAQYEAALPFVGNFAIVQDLKEKIYVINKKNEKIFSINHSVDVARLYKMEKTNIVLLLTINYSGIGSIEGLGLFDRGPFIMPSRRQIKVFNLSTGKQIYNESSDFINWDKPKILLIDDYVIFQSDDGDWNGDIDEYVNIGTKVYKMNNSGKLDACTITAEELIMQIAKERNMVPKEYETSIGRPSGIKWFFNNTKSFTYSNPNSSIFGPYFGFIDKIDSNIFLQNIPENLHLHNYAFTLDRFPEGTRIEDLKAAGYSVYKLVDKHEYDIYPINRKEEYPLQEDFSLYGVKLKDNKDDSFHGLYDALENKWVIPPVEEDNFYSTHYNNFIGTDLFDYKGEVFYNIKTRKKYTNMFYEQTNHFTFPYLIYYGHYIKEYEKRTNKKYNDKEWSVEDY